MAADKATYLKQLHPKQPPITKRAGQLSHTSDHLMADPRRREVFKDNPYPDIGKHPTVRHSGPLFEPIRLEGDQDEAVQNSVHKEAWRDSCAILRKSQLVSQQK